MEKPLVFIHGAGDSARAWREQVALFGERAYALDLPGHGERADTLPEQVRVEDYARAAWAIVRTELGLERPVIAGHSLGGLIALQMGLDFGAELGGLILLGTGARMRVASFLLEAARSDPEQAQRTLKQFSVAEQGEPGLAARLVTEQNRPRPGMLYRDLMACHRFDVMTRLGEIRLPTLIICGAEERNAPVKHSMYLHEHIASSELQIIAGAGHYVQLEKANEVNQAIAAWLVRN